MTDRDWYRQHSRAWQTTSRVSRSRGSVLFSGLGASALLAVAIICIGRVLSWFDVISLPWFQDAQLWLVYGIVPVELLVALGASIFAIGLFSQLGLGRGLLAAGMTAGVLVTAASTVDRDVWLGVTWRGLDGERRESVVFSGPATFAPTSSKIAKADGTLVKLLNSTTAHDPESMDQIYDFLRRDRTDELPYEPGRFVCADFAERLHNQAEAAGLRCAYVTLDFANGEMHASNAFRLRNGTMVFVDCTNSRSNGETRGPSSHDTLVRVEVGRQYTPKPINDVPWTFQPMGVVQEFAIQW